RKSFRLLIVLAVMAVPMFAQTVAAADQPTGTSPDNAIDVNGVATGGLAAQSVRWYKVFSDGSSGVGVAMNYNPASNAQDPVLFNVDWANPSGQPNADAPGLFRVGQGTQSGLPSGQRYWFTSQSVAATYYIE